VGWSHGVDDRSRLVHAFWDLDDLRERENRTFYLRLLEEELGHPLPFKRDGRDFHDLWHFVDACLAYPGAVHILVAVAEKFHRGSEPMNRVHRLVEEFMPEPLLLAAERRELHRLVTPLADEQITPSRLAAIRALYRKAVGPLGPVLEGDVVDLPQVLAKLEEVTVSTDGTPPLLAFVDDLAVSAEGAIATELDRWAGGLAERLRLRRTTAPGRLPSALPPAHDEPRAHLIIQFRPDAVDQERFLPSAWLQHEGEQATMLHCDDGEPLPAGLLPGLVERLLTEDHHVVSRPTTDLTVEFFLPHRLLDTPVDQFRITVGGLQRRLGIEHPVVVRSLDRLQNRVLHHNWRRKWKWLRDHPADATVCWVTRRGVFSGESLYNSILYERSAVCLAMTFPPRATGDQPTGELWIGVQAGTPIAVWSRTPRDPARFTLEFQELLEGGTMALPDNVLALRRRALKAQDSAPADDHLGFHLTLMFDDPDRIPEPYFRLSAPA
jgi:vWA-MoxR associated protein C-terminal domain/vWA-MoxR associated protein middle region 0/Effector-associated domain 2